MSSIFVRKAVREDMVDLMEMIKELAIFEGVPKGPKITHEDLVRDGFDSNPPKFISMVAEDRETGKLAGHIFGNFAYSTWVGMALFIEDIYVREEYRKMKIGHLLMKEYCKFGKSLGCCRIDWHVLMENAPAIKFYKQHGAYCLQEVEKRYSMRMPADEMIAVADAEE